MMKGLPSSSGNKRPHASNMNNINEQRPQWSRRLGARSTTTLAVLSVLAMTTTPVAESFVHPTKPHRLTPGITGITTGMPIHSRFPSTTALGYDHDKSHETDVQVSVNNDEHHHHGQEASSKSSSSERQGNFRTPPSTLVNIRYRGDWYDVTNWRKAHSAGAHWLDWFDKRDATEIIDGLHSTHSRQMTTRLPKATPEVAAELEANTAPDSKVQIAFRKLFDQMLDDGWWERDIKFEVGQLSIWAGLVLGAAATVTSAPLLSFVLLAFSFTGAGWLGHDYIHGLDPFSKAMRNFLPLTTGLSCRWWSDKHNKHHALTNEIGVDEDMATDPILYTWAPDPSEDSFLRKIQHYIFWLPFSLLFFVWRIDSVKAAVQNVELKRKDARSELYAMMAHYAIMFTLFPVNVWVPAFLLSGIMTAFVVTSTHQSEEKFTKFIPDHITRQFLCTRSVVMSNPLSAWVWGGMQYQIEHHLFPSIPRSKLPALKPIIQKFAKDNNVESGYRESGELEILKMNWDTYRAAALADPVEGAPLTRGVEGQQAAIAGGFTAVTPLHHNKKDDTDVHP